MWLQRRGARVSGMALPPEDPDGAYPMMAPWDGLDSHHQDVRDEAGVARVVESTDPEVIFHLAAQALVRRGLADPFDTYAVNVAGTLNVLHAARRAPSLRAVVVVTSDKVYAQAGNPRTFREGDPLGGEDPYSGSKALAELVVQTCRASCMPDRGAAVATARAGNVIGGGDRGEDRLLPDAWRALEADQPLLVRNPTATRPWQFVLEPLLGYLLLAERLVADPADVPSAVNFGPSPEDSRPVAEVLDRLFELCGRGRWRVDDRPHPPEAQSLALDATIARHVLGWQPRLSLDDALAWTVRWWKGLAAGDDLRRLAGEQLEAYESLL